MNPDNKNMLLAIVLSVLVFGAWQYFIGVPQVKQQREATAQIHAQAEAQKNGTPGPAVPSTTAATTAALKTRAEVIASSARVPLDTPRLTGSIDLKGGRLDDVALKTYHETVNPASPLIVSLSPSGTPIVPGDHATLNNQGPYYADFGWAADASAKLALPGPDTVWKQTSTGPLTPKSPAVLEWDNGSGLTFRRTVSVDEAQMFTVADEVSNHGTAPVSLSPYALVSRHGTPTVGGYYLLHEGLIGVIGADGLQEYKYKDIDKDVSKSWQATGGWIGITDKYWATTLVPDQGQAYTASYSSRDLDGAKAYQTDLLFQPRSVAPGASVTSTTRLFTGAKEVALLNGYESSLGIKQFDLLIDWGWFYFITKPLFWLIDTFYHLIGNFGLAILATTVVVKLALFPLANKSYESMSKMKKIQPEQAAIRERFPDDKVKQQQATMALYKENKINPLAGCLPMVVQVPVFFALYKVLFITIEMRHQPFYGWIHDLSAPDPTTIFNLFGLIPWTPPAFLMIGVWPLVMGVTMFLQMQLNPAPTDPTQAAVFRYMPLIFLFTMSGFPAGLVLYYSWNNSLSILQQSVMMKRFGVKIELFDNLKAIFMPRRATAAAATTGASVPASPVGTVAAGANAKPAGKAPSKPVIAKPKARG